MPCNGSTNVFLNALTSLGPGLGGEVNKENISWKGREGKVKVASMHRQLNLDRNLEAEGREAVKPTMDTPPTPPHPHTHTPSTSALTQIINAVR